MIYYDENDPIFDADELGNIRVARLSLISKLRQEGHNVKPDSQITTKELQFIGRDDITDEYVFEYDSATFTVPVFCTMYTKIYNYVYMVKERTEEQRELLKKKCNSCYRGNYMQCNANTNPRCLQGSIDACDAQIERLESILKYMKENPDENYSTDWSKSMYTEVYKKFEPVTVTGFEAKFNTQQEKWEVCETEYNYQKQIGITTNNIREIDNDFNHEKFSGSTDIMKSMDRSRIAMTVDYLNKGYTILCRNCHRVTFFDPEYIQGLKETGKMNLPVRCSACKDRLIEMNK